MTKSLEELDAEVADLRLQIDTLLRLLSASVPGITSAQFKRQLEQARRHARGVDVLDADDDDPHD
jgi:hypothetical protein